MSELRLLPAALLVWGGTLLLMVTQHWWVFLLPLVVVCVSVWHEQLRWQGIFASAWAWAAQSHAWRHVTTWHAQPPGAQLGGRLQYVGRTDTGWLLRIHTAPYGQLSVYYRDDLAELPRIGDQLLITGRLSNNTVGALYIAEDIQVQAAATAFAAVRPRQTSAS